MQRGGHIVMEGAVGGVDDPPLHPAFVSAFEIYQGHN